jgi:hypothetical protein
MFGKDVIEEGGSSISDVEKTGGSRSKTDTHIGIIRHLLPFLSPVLLASKLSGSKSQLQIQMSK